MGVKLSLVRSLHVIRQSGKGMLDSLLAVLWTFWAAAVDEPVPPSSPHLRDHQRWYLEATRAWLASRLASGHAR